MAVDPRCRPSVAEQRNPGHCWSETRNDVALPLSAKLPPEPHRGGVAPSSEGLLRKIADGYSCEPRVLPEKPLLRGLRVDPRSGDRTVQVSGLEMKFTCESVGSCLADDWSIFGSEPPPTDRESRSVHPTDPHDERRRGCRVQGKATIQVAQDLGAFFQGRRRVERSEFRRVRASNDRPRDIT